MGTVTATAVELALSLTKGDIYLAGMDLGVKDIRSHVRPYAFDYLQSEKANRFTPVYSQTFTRSSLIQGGGSLDIYSAWFKKQLLSWPKRVYFFDEQNIFSHAVKNIGNFFKAENTNNKEGNFRERGIKVLLDALKAEKYSPDLKKELVSLLFAGKEDVSDEDLINLIEKSSRKDAKTQSAQREE
jgi:hypothetical protein